MILTREQLLPLFRGILALDEEDGWLVPQRFSTEQLEALRENEVYYVRARHTASVRLCFRTDATQLRFRYRLQLAVNNFSIDVSVNDALHTVYVPEAAAQMADRLADTGEGLFECSLPAGDKTVTVTLPTYSRLSIRDFGLNGSVLPTEPRRAALWLGDSISQGGHSEISACSVVNTAMRRLGWDVLNQSIGGMTFNSRCLLPAAGYAPEIIVVALGTNGCTDSAFPEEMRQYFRRLAGLYPGVPTVAVTPTWRADAEACACLEANRDRIAAVCSEYPNIQVIDGFTLTPHTQLLLRDHVHPNEAGCMLYAENLANAIQGSDPVRG